MRLARCRRHEQVEGAHYGADRQDSSYFSVLVPFLDFCPLQF